MKDRPPPNASEYTKWLKEKANLELTIADARMGIPAYERHSIISQIPTSLSLTRVGLTLFRNNIYTPPPFAPSDIAGLSLWLDASDTATVEITSSKVSTWSDKSGNLRNATQTDSGRRPTYVTSGVVFTASSTHFMNIDVPFNTSHSVFLVSQSVSGTENYYYSRAVVGGAPTIVQHYGGTRKIEYYDGNVDRATFAESPPSSSPSMVNFVRSVGNTVTGFYNGNSAFSISQTSTGNTVNPWRYIGRSDTANYLNATIFEFIIFRTALTTTQRQKVEGYLAWKWGLQASLPSSHPYFSAKP